MLNKYLEWMCDKGIPVCPGPHTGQTVNRMTRFTYNKGPMYYLGEHIVKAMQDSGYPAFIWQCYRPPQEQAKYKARGTSKAGPWESPHQFYEAVDILHPEHYWVDDPDYWEQLATCVRIVAERFGVQLEHGHYWSFVDSAHIELKDWRCFRADMEALWEREADGGVVKPQPPDQAQLAIRFKEVLPKVWKQHTRIAKPSPKPQFLTRRQRRNQRRGRRE